MSDTFLERTSSNSSNNQRIGTISVWLKRAKLGTTQYILANYIDGNNYGYFRFDSSDRIHYVNAVSGSHSTDVVTSRKFKDTFAWYHLCVAVDSTQGTASNRVKIYVNGTQETAFDTGSYGSQNDSHRMWMASASGGHRMGSQQTTQSHFDGCMSHFHFIDGTAYAASSFGSTDSTTGEWQINTSPSVTYGSEGYFMLKNDNSLTDQSGEGNNFIVGNGTLTKTEDCPSNVFATFNPSDNGRNYSGTIDLKNGNTTQQNASDASLISSLGMKTGKWYAEFKIVNATNTRTVGIIDISESQGYIAHGSLAAANSYGYKTNGQSLWNGTTEVATNVGEGVAGDIIGVAIDLDSSTKTIKWTKNGSDLSGTTSINISQSDVTWAFFVRADGGQTISANFGNGFFQTTAVSSAGTNASNLGIFEYNVPTGYTALCTKGLNE